MHQAAEEREVAGGGRGAAHRSADDGGDGGLLGTVLAVGGDSTLALDVTEEMGAVTTEVFVLETVTF